MANKDFTSVEALLKHLQAEATKTLRQPESNVKNVVVKEMIDSFEENYYDAYDSPARNPYVRQRGNDGLIDPDNFRVERTNDGVAISSSRRGIDGNGNNVDVVDVLEGYAPWGVEDVWGYGFNEPRHAIEPAREKLRNSKYLSKALKLDLKNIGFDVE